MNLSIENILLIGSVLLFLSILAGKTTYRFGVPTLILFLMIGMLAGSEGLGGIHFDNPQLAQFVGVVALNFILFSGGLDTDWKAIRPVMSVGISLSTLGVLLTALALGGFVWLITDLKIFEALLLGSIVSSTDAAAVFSILRSKSLALRSRLRPALELESGSNDPMAYVLMTSFLALVVQPEKSGWSFIPLFFQQMLAGAGTGFLFGWLSRYIINNIKFDFDGLYPALVVSLVFATYSLTDFVGGNGFLAVYLCAVYLGNQDIIHKRMILKIFDGFAWLMQIILFLTLGLLVFPSHVLSVAGVGLIISAFLILVARPLSVFLSLALFRIRLYKQGFLSWVGLRGAVPIVFATYPMVAGIEQAEFIFNIVFFISLSSVVIQGTTIPLVAKIFRVSAVMTAKPRSIAEKILAEIEKGSLHEVQIRRDSPAVGKRIVDLKIPADSLIITIQRAGSYFTPRGSTQIEAHDHLFILTESEGSRQELMRCLGVQSGKKTTKRKPT